MRYFLYILFFFSSFSGLGNELPKTVMDIIKNKKPVDQIKLLDSIASSYTSEDFNKAKETFHYAIKLAKQNDLKVATVRLYVHFAKQYRAEGIYDEAIKYIDSAKVLAFKNNLSQQYANIFDIEGLIYTKMADYEKAAQAFYKCIEYAEKEKDTIKIHHGFGHLGVMHFYRTDYRSAILFYNKSLKVLNQSEISQNYILTLDNIALCYANLNLLDSALIFQRKVVAYAEKINDSIFLAECYINMGSTLSLLKNYQESEKYHLKGLFIHDILKNKYGVLIANKELGRMYIEAKQYDKALLYLQKAYEAANELQIPLQIKSVIHDLANAYKGKEDFKNAARYYEMEIKLAKEIFDKENEEVINELSAKYESEKQQQQIQLLTKDKQLQDEELEKQRTFKIFIAVVAVLFSIISVILFISFRQKKKDNKLLYEKNEAIENQKNQIELQKELLEFKNKEITDSINYAKRIQGSVLPSQSYFQKILPDSFIYFKPKDIISGDFYWINENNQFVYMVLADCTGHGVPGAMMSMLGASLLNQIIQSNKIESPADILKELHFHIVKTLNENISEQNSVDGMDIALVRIDKNKKEIVYAGAGRPLLVFKENKLVEYKSNKFSIGGSYDSKSVVCNADVISYIDAPIQLYLFSDGVIDQFGGEKGKKFMTKQLKEFVVKTSNDTIVNQEGKFINLFERWKGNYDQIDDITFISFQLS